MIKFFVILPGAEFFFQLTESGEENSTTQIRTLDAVTEVKSGNNTVQYTYDDKGKVTSVNAPDHSETFAYDEQDNTLDSKTVTVDGITHTYECSTLRMNF